MAVAIPLALSIIPILIAFYAVRVSLRAGKYARTRVELRPTSPTLTAMTVTLAKRREGRQWPEKLEE
jgi:hypothetical protein